MKADKSSLLKESNALTEATTAVFEAIAEIFAQYSEGSIEVKKHSANFVMTVRLERKEGRSHAPHPKG